jgi:hypothetical protein
MPFPVSPCYRRDKILVRQAARHAEFTRRALQYFYGSKPNIGE